MKFLTKVALVLCLAGVVSACEDLDVSPTNSITEDQFYTNRTNLLSGLYGVYDALQGSNFYGQPTQLDGLSDNLVTTNRNQISFFAAGLDFDGLAGLFSEPYVLIQRANLLLDNIDNVGGVSDEEKGTIAAEARGLRAMAYIPLVYFYGNIPLVTTTLERTEYLSVSQSSRSEVVSFILEELEEAASILDNSPVEDGRLTRPALLSLRAKVLVFEARLGNSDWAVALAAINEAMSAAEGIHDLVDTDDPSVDYQSVFVESNEGNPEILFAVRKTSADGGYSYQEFYSWRAGILIQYPHQNLADAYPYADGSAYDPQDDTFENRDPRLSVNIMHPGLTFDGLTYGVDDGFIQGNANESATSLFVYKFSTTDFSANLNRGALDTPIMRYADLLLLHAEALNETGGDPYPSLNAVRDRAGLPPLQGLAQGELRDAILLERRLELAFEGHRWYDLITTGRAEAAINGIVEEDPLIIREFTVNRNELLPLPETELAINSNLVQNPGY